MNIILARQVDGKVNVYAPRENKSVDIPAQFASEITAFKWLLSQNGVRMFTETIVNDNYNWRTDEEDNISGEYDVNVKRL